MFRVKRANTFEELWRIFEEYPNAYPVAGGTDIIPRVNQGIERHDVYVSIEGIKDMHGISVADSGDVKIGALTKLVEVTESDILADFAALNCACSKVASPQIRNQATIGGNVLQENRCIYFNQSVSWRRINPCFKLGGDRCYQYKGSPKCVALFQSDVAPVMMSYGAEAVFVSKSGERKVPLASIYLDAGKKDKAKDEILSHLIIPKHKGKLVSAYTRETIRGSFDFPLVGCAITIVLDNGKICEATIVMGSAGVMPRFVPETQNMLVGKTLDEATHYIEDVKQCASRVVFPFRDSRIDTQNRKAFAQKLVDDAWKSLLHKQ
ncbi:FAD binding domain-containing protein [uncultured Cloacibacillus sp.]|uniref:FAD binding domain-containing protein n=1 Tax=uncultured Cloacibacillus sp. TaxID=889794 RepID=UPI00320938EA